MRITNYEQFVDPFTYQTRLRVTVEMSTMKDEDFRAPNDGYLASWLGAEFMYQLEKWYEAFKKKQAKA